jgi:hypothetical protein
LHQVFRRETIETYRTSQGSFINHKMHTQAYKTQKKNNTTLPNYSKANMCRDLKAILLYYIHSEKYLHRFLQLSTSSLQLYKLSSTKSTK